MPPAGGLCIAVDGHVLDGKPQGSRTWLLNTLLRAIPKAPEIRWLIYTGKPGSFEPFAGLANAERRVIPFSSSILRLGLFWPVTLALHEADVTLFQYHGPPIFGRRQMVVIHDLLFETHPQFFSWPMRWRLKLLTRRAARSAQATLTVSHHSRSALLSLYGLAPTRVFLAPNGCPPPKGGVKAVRDGRTVLFVGRIEPRKNLGLLLDAFERMTTPHRRLAVVGAPEVDGAADLARLNRTPDAIHLGSLPDDALSELYRTAAVLAFPSSGEGFGLPVIEALSAGLPAVVSNATAIPEVAGPFAEVFDPEAPDAAATLARLLDGAIANPPSFSPDDIAAHLAQFDWSLAADALLSACRAIREPGLTSARRSP